MIFTRHNLYLFTPFQLNSVLSLETSAVVNDRICGKIYTYLSDFFAFLGVKVLGKKLVLMFVGSVQIISLLHSESKFEMSTLFFGRHIGEAKSSTNMAAAYWSL